MEGMALKNVALKDQAHYYPERLQHLQEVLLLSDVQYGPVLLSSSLIH